MNNGRGESGERRESHSVTPSMMFMWPIQDYNLNYLIEKVFAFHTHTHTCMRAHTVTVFKTMDFIGLSYIYERPMLMGRLNLKMFKFGKCMHFQ